MPLIRVSTVEPLSEGFTARVVFTNGECRDIDLTPYIATGPIFEPVRNETSVFRAMRVEGGTIAWPNGADIDPDVLYLGLPPNASEAEWKEARANAERNQPTRKSA
jgi:hypothetical protein